MSSSGRGLLGWPPTVALLGAVYVAAVQAVHFAPSSEEPVASWWPAAGLAVILVALSPRRRWPALTLAIAVVSAAANMTGGRPFDLSVGFGIANAAEALVAALVLCRGRERLPMLDSLEDFVRLVGAAAAGAFTIATLAAASVALLSDGSFFESWRSVFASHAASTLVIVPVVMTRRRSVAPRRAWELPVQAAALAAVTLAVFSPDQALSLTFVPLPVLVWAALRFDLRAVTWELVGFSVMATFLSARGYGPFGYDYVHGDLDAIGMGALVQGYLLAAALLALPLAIGMDQRRRALVQLTRSERLFRRNFTEAPQGMLLLRSAARPFEITDLNEAAGRILGGSVSPRGRGLGDVLEIAEPLGEKSERMISGVVGAWRDEAGVTARPGARVTFAVSLLATDPEPVFSVQLLDVTAEQEARRQLEAAEKLTSATLDTAATIIMVTDLEGTVVRANNAVATLTGFTEAEVVGRPIWETPLAPEGATGLPAGMPTEPDGQVSRETDVLTRGGGKLRVLWNTGLVRDEHDQPEYVVLTGTDLTAERAAAGLNAHLLEAAITTALIGIDPRGLITVFNSGAAHLLGYDAQDMVGTPFTDLLDPEERLSRTGGRRPETAFAALTAAIGAGGESSPRDWTWVGSDGSRHTMSMTLSVASDRVASRIGYLCVGRDVTEARASQELLVAALDKERMAVERLRQLDGAKNEFVSTVSHELRTPVASIVGYTEMLQDGSVDEPTAGQSRLLASIERSGQRLIALCDDLLTLGGLDSGALHWDRTAIDLNGLVAAAEDTIKPLLAGRDLEVTFVRSPSPVLVLGDRAQLDRVLINLLSNAVKFTEDGGRVECRVGVVSGEATLVVSDTGIGIPEDEQASLFQRFFRSSTAQHRAIQGTGLGLSIVAATVAAHGGRIDVRSAHLEGTTITVRLPVTRMSASASAGPGEARPG